MTSEQMEISIKAGAGIAEACDRLVKGANWQMDIREGLLANIRGLVKAHLGYEELVSLANDMTPSNIEIKILHIKP